MHKPSRLQPLTLNPALRSPLKGGRGDREASCWSSDSDSGVAADSYSPPSSSSSSSSCSAGPPSDQPSHHLQHQAGCHPRHDHHHPRAPHHLPAKTSPDSGVGLDPPQEWTFPPPSPPPPPPSPPPLPHPSLGLHSRDQSGPMTSSAAATSRAGLSPSPPPPAPLPQSPLEMAASMAVLNVQDEEERRRQQDYVRRTLMQYERQRMLDEQRQGSLGLSQGQEVEEDEIDEISAEYDQNDILEALEADRARLNSLGQGLSRGKDRRSNARVHFSSDFADSGCSNGGVCARAGSYDNAHNYGFRQDPQQDPAKGYRINASDLCYADRPKNVLLSGGKAKQFGPDLVPAKHPNDFYSGNNTVGMDKLSQFYQSGGQESCNAKSLSDAANRTSSRGGGSDTYPTLKNPLPPRVSREGGNSPEGISSKRFGGLTDPQRRAIPNDYVPSKLIDQLRENANAPSPKPDKSSDVIEDVARRLCDAGHGVETRYGEDLRQGRDELDRRLRSGGGGTPAETATPYSSLSSPSSYPFRAEGRGVVEGSESFPDEGYGTSDSRSSGTTTATSSLASPLSSSLSSLTTDSSGSLNGSQRLPTSPGASTPSSISSSSAPSAGPGSAKAPPVPSGGRLVVARRPMLVKRKDLPPVDFRGGGGDYGVSLEERLRALTTIEEEEQGGSAAGSASTSTSASTSASASAGLPHSSHSHSHHAGLPQTRAGAVVPAGPPSSPPLLPPRAEGRPEPPKRKPDLSGSGPGSRPRGGQGEEGPGYEEGVSCWVDKRPHRALQPTANVPLVRRTLPEGRSPTESAHIKDSAATREGDGTAGGREGGAGNLYRAVPVLVQPDGVPRSYSPATGHHRAVDQEDAAPPSQARKATSGSGAPRYGGNNSNNSNSGSNSSKEVRFKAGGGGVKLNAESGRFEIDYSYYMKASPSESNDEVNTYSPDTTRAELPGMDAEKEAEDAVFHDVIPTEPRLRSRGPPGSGWDPPRAERSAFRSPALLGEDEAARAGADNFRAIVGRSAQKQARVHFQEGVGGGAGGEAGLRASEVMSSMPNLSLQTHPARHSVSGDMYLQDLPSRYNKSGEADFYGTASAGGDNEVVGTNGLQRHASALLADGSREASSTASSQYPSSARPASHRAFLSSTQQQQQQQQPPPYRRNPTPGSGYPAAGVRRLGQGDRKSCDVGSLYRQTDLSQTFPPASQGVIADRMSLNLGDLPRIQEQLRATSEMLLSTGKRHQFASSSDIYKLFQGQQQQQHQQQPPPQQQQQQQQQEVGFPQGRQPPYRHSFHHFASSQPSSQSLTEVRARARTSSGGQTAHCRALGKNEGAETSALQGPVRADHSLAAAVNSAYGFPYGGGGGRDAVRSLHHSRDVCRSSSDANLSSRDVSLAVPGGRVTPSFRERLSRGEQFVTDVIQDHDGEKLSTLV